jgi:SurA N-terminal domain
MAVIGNIRNRMGGLLVVAVGGALLLFVVSDFLENRRGVRGDRSIGEIGGEEIDVQAFERRVDEQAEVYRSNGTTVDAQLQEQIRNNVWNEILRERTLFAQASAAGLGDMSTFSREEFDDIRFGNNVLPDFKGNPNFQDPATGQPDKTKLRNYFKAIQEQAPMFYELQKRTFVTERIIGKYNALVKKSCFVNSLQVADDYNQKNEKAAFNFVAKRYDSEPVPRERRGPAPLLRCAQEREEVRAEGQPFVPVRALPGDRHRERHRRGPEGARRGAARLPGRQGQGGQHLRDGLCRHQERRGRPLHRGQRGQAERLAHHPRRHRRRGGSLPHG